MIDAQGFHPDEAQGSQSSFPLLTSGKIDGTPSELDTDGSFTFIFLHPLKVRDLPKEGSLIDNRPPISNSTDFLNPPLSTLHFTLPLSVWKKIKIKLIPH